MGELAIAARFEQRGGGFPKVVELPAYGMHADETVVKQDHATGSEK